MWILQILRNVIEYLYIFEIVKNQMSKRFENYSILLFKDWQKYGILYISINMKKIRYNVERHECRLLNSLANMTWLKNEQ